MNIICDLQNKRIARWADEKPNNRPRRQAHLPSAYREEVWRRYNGDLLDGECWLCGRDLKFTDFDAAHMRSKHEGGKTRISNLCPCHRKCNSDMNTMSARKYQKIYYPHLVDKPMRSGKRRWGLKILMGKRVIQGDTGDTILLPFHSYFIPILKFLGYILYHQYRFVSPFVAV